MLRSTSRLLVLALWLGSARPAFAEDDPRKAASVHYQRGVELANRAEYRAALDEFGAAYAASPNFAVLYNIGQAEVAVGRTRQALASLARYLKDGGAEVPAARRAQVAAQIAVLEASFAYLSVATEPTGVVVNVDGKDVGTTPLPGPLRLEPGSHVVQAARPGSAPVTRVVDIPEGKTQALELRLPVLPPADAATKPFVLGAPASPPEAAASRSRPAEPPPVPDARPFPTGYALLGGGVVVGGVALAHYFWNAERVREFRRNEARLATDPAPGRRQRQLDNNELASSIDSASTVTVVLGVASGALVGGGVSYLSWSGTW